ncbi:MAG: RidA family protein [Rhodospirillaceae bacterium]|nr:RidA family protein [Rhodospirillaceae bacterium]
MSARDRKPVFYGSAPPYPISRAVRAGDFVITCAMGDRAFAPEEAVYDADGRPLATGRRLREVTFAEEVHGTFRAVSAALAEAGCTLADVIDVQVWLRDPRDFHEMNRIYEQYFTTNRPVRSVFRNDFMFEFRIEMKVVAYKPL